MAAFANDSSQLNVTGRPLPPNSHRQNPSNDPPTRPRESQLPQGACNYRDLAAGPKPVGCGCRRFWLGYSLPRIGQLGLSQTQEPWCACGHHACFHDRKESSKKRGNSTESSLNSKQSTSQGQEALAPARGSGFNQPWAHDQVRSPTQGLISHNERRPGRSNSDNPQIPSFHLTSSELRGYTNYRGSVGLGLDFQRSVHAARIVSQSPTVADALSSVGDLPATEPLPSTRQASADDRVSPDGAFMRHILEGRRQVPQLDVSSTFKAPIGLGFGDLIQSATEVATPSVAATPRLTEADQLVNAAADIVGTLERGVAAVGSQAQSPTGLTIVHTDHTHGTTHQQRSSEVATLPSTQLLQDVLQDVPGALQRLAPLLSSLQDYLSRRPDISVHESINSLVKRMENLENASFNHMPPEQVHEQFQHMDMRLLDLENRTDEHGRLIANFDPDNSDRASQIRCRISQAEQASFTSNHSGQTLGSNTSTALIAAAIDRLEAQERFKAVEDRLDVLEALQMPSASLPWEVEVVFLPWGRELRGLWYEAADFAKPGVTQDDEDWTQAKGSKSVSRASMSLGESGWTDSAINQWADDEEEKMWPKACGVNGIVYHRLKSRGLVHKVTLISPGARDIIGAISKKFGEMLHTFSQGHTPDATDEDSEMEDYLGMSAPFIPLRKIHKSSRLSFLSDSELITSTLWSAEFLAAGVMMRASGGQKRLFITSRSGYDQDKGDGWTWSRLRQLPRIHYPDSQKTTGDNVPEADAREPCWKHHATIDGASSAGSSFRADVSNETEHVLKRNPVDLARYIEYQPPPNAAEPGATNASVHHPITPTSEFPPTQASTYHHQNTRAISVSLSEAALPSKSKSESLQQPARPVSQQAKRRIRSFEQAANPSLIASLPTFVPSPAKTSMRSMRIKKRRRITRSKSASSAELATQSSGQADIQSLHPEADPEQVLQHLQDVIPNGGEIKPLGYFIPRSRDGVRQRISSFETDVVSYGDGRAVSAGRAERRGVTPSAYATPYSGTVAESRDPDDDYMPSESEDEEGWAGVDEDQVVSNSEDEEFDDEMDEASQFDDGSVADDGDAAHSDELHDDVDDDEMISSEDELQRS